MHEVDMVSVALYQLQPCSCSLEAHSAMALQTFGARQWSLLRFLVEDMVAFVAIVAVYVGSWSPLEIVKFAVMVKAFLVLVQVLKVAVVGVGIVHGVLETFNYMERRLMRLQYRHGDMTRQLQQDLEEFEEERSSGCGWSEGCETTF